MLGIVAAGGLLSMMIMPEAVQAVAKATESIIVNDDSRPVPTKAIGTTDVAGIIKVTNGAADAIPVTVTNQPTGASAPQPYQEVTELQFGAGGVPSDYSLDAVWLPPNQADKMLVIESVSGQWSGAGEIDEFEIGELCDFGYGLGGFGGGVALPVGPKGHSQPIGGLTKLFITPGACWQVAAHVSGPTTGKLKITVTGWLHPVASAQTP